MSLFVVLLVALLGALGIWFLAKAEAEGNAQNVVVGFTRALEQRG